MKMNTTHLLVHKCLFVVLMITASSHLLPVQSQSPCLESDYVALRALYLNTDGDNWINNTNWMTENEFINNAGPPNNLVFNGWHGITVDNSGCVTEINLDFNNLDGQVPFLLGIMAKLKVLNLASNKLIGEIPNDLGNILGLEYLFLKYNQLTGPIPADLADLDQLIILSIHDNQLSGTIPKELGRLKYVENLMLDDNHLSGEIPDDIGLMSSIINLRLGGNNLTGTLPGSIGDLTELNVLTFHNNQLTGCFDQNLIELCSQIATSQNSYTSDDNHYCVSWEQFCLTLEGLCGTPGSDDFCDCQTTLNLHENPEPQFINRASFHITSDDMIDHNEFTSYTAGDHVDLDQGFEIKLGSSLLANIDECAEECAVTEPCEGPPCAPLDLEYDDDGNPYFKNQIAIVFPSVSTASVVTADDLETFLDSIIYNFHIESGPSNYDFEDFMEATSISQCLCDYNIFLYEVNDTYEINEEGGGVAASGDGGPMEEGPSYVVNHVVDAGMTSDEDPIQDPPSIFDMQKLNSDSNLDKQIVAFLDSGVDPRYVPGSSLLADSIGRKSVINNYSCRTTNTVDKYGWNFVDFDSNVVDDRGHGTSVFRAYIHALNKLNVAIDDQNSLIVKVLDECGRGSAYSTACGISYAVARNADIINTSWGLYTNNTLLQTAIDYAVDEKGVLVSSSSGNQSKDLSFIDVEHFPSAYGYTHNRIDDFENGDSVVSEGYDKVFEVGGLCRDASSQSCLSQNEIVNLWSGSNYRSTGPQFSEPGIEIQKLYPITIECGGILGTSYAAPQFTAGLLNEHIKNNGNTDINHNLMIANSIAFDGQEQGVYYSYLLNNQSCTN